MVASSIDTAVGSNKISTFVKNKPLGNVMKIEEPHSNQNILQSSTFLINGASTFFDTKMDSNNKSSVN